MVMFDLRGVPLRYLSMSRGAWKSTSMVHGGLSVMTSGTSGRLMWCAGNLVTMMPQVHLREQPTVKALIQSTMMMLCALGVRNAWSTASMVVLESITVIMQ